jgi:hypothetical protein
MYICSILCDDTICSQMIPLIYSPALQKSNWYIYVSTSQILTDSFPQSIYTRATRNAAI